MEKSQQEISGQPLLQFIHQIFMRCVSRLGNNFDFHQQNTLELPKNTDTIILFCGVFENNARIMFILGRRNI